MSSTAPTGPPTRFVAVEGEATRTVEVVALGEGRYRVTVDGRAHEVDCRPTGTASFSLLVGNVATEASVLARGDTFAVQVAGRTRRFQLLDERAARRGRRAAAGEGGRELRAAMPGKVVAVLVEPGAEVTAGQGLLVIEAMKMENEVGAPRAGTVREIRVRPGQAVEAGELLAIVE